MPSQNGGGGPAKGSGCVHGYPQTDSYYLGTVTKKKRGLRMEDSSSFFNNMRIEPLMFDEILNRFGPTINTHYHNSNLIWRTVSRLENEAIYHWITRRVDEVIPSDHPRRVASRVIQWYGLILYARSSYYYDNMFIICLLSDILSGFKTCFGL